MAVDQTRERLEDLTGELTRLLTPPLLEIGLDLEAVDVTPAGRRRLVRVAVDKDGGVTLDDVAAATKEVSRRLDEADAMGEQPYTLEVTSPGIDRPLALPRHWRRNEGRLVKVTTTDKRTLTGRVVQAREDRVVLDIDGGRRELEYAEVSSARVQVEFNRPAGQNTPKGEGA